MSNIDYQSPMYLQLREIIRTKIEDGEFPPGTAIPTEHELAKTYGINRLTVRNGISSLVNEGLLKRIQGKGVFVLGEKREHDLETLEGFSQMVRKKNANPSFQILTKSLRNAEHKYSKIFNIQPGEQIFYIKRVDYIDNEPYSLEEIYIPHHVFPQLGDIDLTIFSVYEIYDFYNIEISYSQQTLDLTQLDQSDARFLDIDSSAPLLLFTNTSYNDADTVIEYSRSYTRPDKANYKVHFKR
ncbi:GntR family transcriptional regulator [Paenibacillus sp. J22TS3]|uniref:GntR family transcriptional regulator n=1 Tax=Paenibacillus sp. J22TS3 TaxID=2807192 RepID=UPI001AFEEBF3|nr:GntR family transcriptional regulator [Paenibacillus sp. J22TS3]GIP22217.1 transcriptional regulator [Paenibacillus sp. J22TS3]